MKPLVGAKLLAAALVVLFGLQTPACQNCDTTGEDPILFTEGVTDPSGTTYETTPISGEWLHFPPGRIFDLRHKLKSPVFSVQSYVSFEPRLASDVEDTKNNFSESAGNQVVYECAEHPQDIRVRNDTCSDFYIRIVAMTSPGSGQQSLDYCKNGAGGESAGGAGGAGGSGP